MGCEGAKAHDEGGNFLFFDGHSRYIHRNAERYLEQRADGKYFTFGMESGR